MPWNNIDEVPANIKTHQGVPLTLEQANRWAELFDGIKSSGGTDNPAAVAWSQWNKEHMKSDDGKSWVKKKESLQEFEPPDAGDAPQEVKDILAKVYNSCRTDWVEENPADKENPENKTSCSKIAWSAVEQAGWKKNVEGKWEKQESSSKLSDISPIRSTTIFQASTIQSLLEKYPPTEEAKAWLLFKKRDDTEAWYSDQIVIADELTEELAAAILWDGEWVAFEVNPEITSVIGSATVAGLPEGGLKFMIERKATKLSLELSAVASHSPPIAPEDEAWDATAAELRIRKWASSDDSGDKEKMDWTKYREGFGWYDSEAEDNAGSYKLPHHDIVGGKLVTVWKGVTAAMGALLGARGGASIPANDKKAIYIHLTNHYKQFEKEAPKLSSCDDYFSRTNPTFVKLSEADTKRTGQSEILTLNGLAIAEGIWKGTKFDAKILKDAISRMTNKRIDVEHEDETWEDVKGFNYKPRWNEEEKGVEVDGVIFDERVLSWYKRNPDTKIGLSVRLSDKAKFELINGQKTCTYFDIQGIALTLNPACKVCWIKTADLVQLSSSDEESDGGVKTMADDKKKEEQPKEQPKQEKKPAPAPAEAPKEIVPPKQPEVAAPAPPTAASSPPESAPDMKYSALEKRVNDIEKAHQTLSDERSKEEVKEMVDDLIDSGQLSEAKREDATKVLLSLSSNEARASFLNAITGKEWKANERGLVLSDKKEEDEGKDKGKEFSEPQRNIIT